MCWSLRISLLLLSLLPAGQQATAQTRPDTLITPLPVTAWSQDPAGHLFLALTDGTLVKYSPRGDSLLAYSPQRIGRVSLLEAWHGFRIFAFYKEFQSFVLFDRFLSRPVRYDLEQAASAYADMCTLSQDQKLWVLEESGFRLLKTDPEYRQVEIDISLDFVLPPGEHDIVFLKEYQNLLFMVDRLHGIYLFDNLGNYLRQIKAEGAGPCQFEADRMYFLAAGKLHIRPLYRGKSQELPLPPGNWQGVLPQPGRVWLIGRNRVLSWTLPGSHSGNK